MTAMRLKRYPSPSGGIALGKMGVGATMLRSILPAGARWVEYLESTGTQYIDTGVAPSTNGLFGMDITFQVLTYNDGCCGTYGPGGSANCYLNFWGNKLYIRKEGYTSTSSDGQSWNDAGFYNPSGWNRVILTNSASINGNLVQSGIVNMTTRNTFTSLLFAYTRSGSITAFSQMRISKCALSLDGDVLRDFRPIAIGTTGYLLDLVSGEYLPYGNAGTGNFVIGPDINAPAI